MLSAHHLSFRYSPHTPFILEAVDLHLNAGEIVGLTGPSGRGKSTLGRLLAGQMRPSGGRVSINGEKPPAGFSPVQYLHQSPVFATDPRWRISRIIEEAWIPDAAAREDFRVKESWYDRYSHEISGGELQRVALLRALAPETRYLISDEITSMLDPLAQAEIWQALIKRAEQGLGILAISHDHALLQRIASRVITL
ncbi:ATP-binding cassette domain-containing protein [Rhodobacterales bacterium]|nr:ATP-binding cassette domain-containing protein [Rhodobacterales bacterium]